MTADGDASSPSLPLTDALAAAVDCPAPVGVSIEHRADPGQAAGFAWWQSFLRGAAIAPCRDLPPLRVLDLFSGCGGLGLGFALAARDLGWRAVFDCAVDTDGSALDVYRRNLSAVRTLSKGVPSLVDYRVRRRRGEVGFAYEPRLIEPVSPAARTIDFVIGGPPCEGHSNLNNHSRRNDPRNDLFVAAVAVALALRPKGILLENVPTVRNAAGEVVDVARALLLASGYHVGEGILRASALGWPQTRERFFLAAVRADCAPGQSPIDADLVALASTRVEPRSVMWAIGDLQDLDGETVFDSPPVPTPENRRRIDYLFENELTDLPNNLRPDCHKSGTSYTAVYGRMIADRPAQTVTTGFGTPGQGRFIHPTRPRLVTPHEAARIQGFPDWFAFDAGERALSRKNLAKWIGDAVPPFLGFVAGRFLLERCFAGLAASRGSAVSEASPGSRGCRP